MIQIDLQIDDEFIEQVKGAALSAAVEETLRQQGIARANVTIVITDDKTVHELNRTFRDVDSPTDILSFPNHEAIGLTDNSDSDQIAAPRLVVPPQLIEEQNSYLGDLIIGFPYTRRQAVAQNRAVDAELLLLVIHGTLHLLGHDHADAQDEAAMWALQNRVLIALCQEPVMP